MRLHLTAGEHRQLKDYLFDDTDRHERVAFLYVDVANDQQDAHTRQVYVLGDDDYVQRTRFGVELRDHVRPMVITTAHETGYAVVEAHAHDWPGTNTQFSDTDLAGLAELGPHMLWRLSGRPYTALVLGPDSFDALQWQPNGEITTIDGLVVDGVNHRPTGRSLRSLTTGSIT